MQHSNINAKNNGIKYPLTQSQQSIWMGQQISPDAPLYNMVHRFDIFGELSPDLFQSAFQHVIAHYDALRIIFGVDSHYVPYQKVIPEYTYALEYFDFFEGSLKDHDLNDFIITKSRIKFDLTRPLFYSCLIKKSNTHFIWFLNVHHLVTDVTSIQLIYNKTADYYQKVINNEKIEGSTIEFVDYIQFEQQKIQDPSNQDIYEYWNKIKNESPPISKIYGQDKDESSTESIRLKIPIEDHHRNQIEELSRRTPYQSLNKELTQYTLFATLLFAFIHRVTRDYTINIGSPTYNRPSQKFRETAGLFIELMPLTVHLEEKDTFASVFLKVRKQIHEMLKHTVSGATGAEISRGVHVVLNYIPIKFGPFGEIPSKMEWLHPGHIDKSHQMRLQVYDFNDLGIELHLDINTSLFSSHQIKEAPNHFRRLIEGLLSNQEQSIGSVSLLLKSEQDRINRKINSQVNLSDKIVSVLEGFNTCKNEYSSSVAIVEDGNEFTFRELDERTNQLANLLSVHGISNGHRVIVLLKRSAGFVLSVLGTLKTGACYVPVPVDYPLERLKRIIANVEPSLIITDASYSSKLRDIKVTSILLDSDDANLDLYSRDFKEVPKNLDEPAYIMYTSGSTGNPKGVIISHNALGNYLGSAKKLYLDQDRVIAPLFTSIGFDLTVTSLFLPLISGGCIRIYEEDLSGHDLSILKVIEDREINFIKLTPSHARLIADMDVDHSNLSTMILGGEDLDHTLARTIDKSFKGKIKMYNEYGPTEATVGCIVKKFDGNETYKHSVPIGLPFANNQAYLLDDSMNMVPEGVPAELYIAGPSLSNGYWAQVDLTNKSFVKNSITNVGLLYKTGDLSRLNVRGELEYLGRIDQQLKIGGIRMEASEIESILQKYSGINQVVIDHYQRNEDKFQMPEHYCSKCGLPSNYPNISFNEEGICDLCLSFDTYQKNVSHYFRDLEALKQVMQQARIKRTGKYDCMMLLSGGKDSSYALAQLVDMNLKVLAFTLENGYISEGAKKNIQTVVDSLGVDHIYGSTDHMNEIFVDSLKRFSNVCNGCFKTLYTLSTQKALEYGIPAIVTGLSRGQFFETRLTEELFRKKQFDVTDIDKTILDARRAYHRIPDAVSKHLDVSMFQTDEVFDQVQFVDFYRYCDVNLTEMLDYLDKRLNWVRPSDTGRSTNCLINDLGIYMHKKERGYHNYSFPYSWDVRMGHKERDEALEELNDHIDDAEVHHILEEIGYPAKDDGKNAQKQLIVYYSSLEPIESNKLQAYLLDYLPPSVIPAKFIHVSDIPLTMNGKADLKALSSLNEIDQSASGEYAAPTNEIEEIVAEIWQEVFQLDQISIHQPFLELGGSSLIAIRIISRINEQVHLDLNVTSVFEFDTIERLSLLIESTIEQLINEVE